jgi:hypothetical protein
MRKLIYSMGVSLDGFIAGPDGEIDWSAPDEELHRFHNQQTGEMGAHLYGRARVLASAWRTLGRYHALVEINVRLAPARLRAVHAPVLGQLRPLLERGQASGAFNPDLPVDWTLTVILELIHAASREVSSGRLSEKTAERALLASVAGALSPQTNRHRAGMKKTR